MERKDTSNHAVNIVDGSRTPFIKATGQPGPFTASDLATRCGQSLLLRQPFLPDAIDEVIIGCVAPAADEANIARIVALRLGCSEKTPAWTVQRNCASGMQAIVSAAQSVAAGESNLVLAGGTEAMSHMPIQYNKAMASWLGRFLRAKKWPARLSLLAEFRPYFLKPVFALLKGLTDPVVNLSMGQTAEIIAQRFHISREMMDAFAMTSHQRLAYAYENDLMSEVESVFTRHGDYYSKDNGLRRDSNIDQLARLKPVFDREYGSVTAGNSAQVTDGAALLILASDDAVTKYNLPVLARVVDHAWEGLDPAEMGLGPVHAMSSLMNKQGLTTADIDYWEINEAFAGQVLACLAAWQDEDYCREVLGLNEAMGHIETGRLNIHGGGISLGHPVGASGARIILHLAHVLAENKAARGIASLCVGGGGQGGAVLLQNEERP